MTEQDTERRLGVLAVAALNPDATPEQVIEIIKLADAAIAHEQAVADLKAAIAQDAADDDERREDQRQRFMGLKAPTGPSSAEIVAKLKADAAARAN